MIEINRNNIESWLMRYIDGELSAVEKMAVENYLVINPDLAAELTALQQAKLPEEAVLYPFKSALLKRLKTQFEESELLDFIDGEADSFTTDAIQEALLDDADLAQQINLLQQAKLPPETMVFADKASLYRQEKKPVPVLWTRMMAAAILLGLGILMWQLLPRYTQQEADSHNLVMQPKLPANHVPTTVIPTEKAPMPIAAATENTHELSENTVTFRTLPVKQTAEYIVQTKETIQPLVIHDPIVQTDNTGTVSAPPVQGTLPANNRIDIAAKTSVNKMEIADKDVDKASAAVTPVVYRLLDIDEEDKERVYINKIPINKNKITGIVQKAGGIFHTLREQENGVQEKLTATAKLR
ncbi:MAG: hypothetical protein KGK14_03810 [Bacteroidota bacterium]|nr:hypothetical protein [Bacteroidota bacterium]